MKPRFVQADLSTLLAQSPAVVLLGPRQAGKTTLALPSARGQLDDPEAFLTGQRNRLVILDEVQRLPELFAVLRGVIDQRRRAGEAAGQFLLLGSASGLLLRQASESLAGRGRRRQPGQREAFIATYLERDIPATTLRRLWTMLALQQGGLLNQPQLAAALAVSGQTVMRYIDLLCDLMLVRRLPAWHGNVGKRLVRAPKVYVRDSGIVHALLGLADLEAILSHPVAGASWEGFVVERLLAAAPAVDASFHRTAHGAEADLVLRFRDGETWVVEINRSSAPTVSKGFHLAAADVGATRKLLVAPVSTVYPLRDGVEVMPPLAAVHGVSLRQP